ncbi:GumC family protein [Rhodocista pekingensis]|uniref:non-specific protein-tyrosine kinase n=1 Tax=Rhodocista pekingensis TaxID=201185 RepID=A0ABW2KVR3_9PROT
MASEDVIPFREATQRDRELRSQRLTRLLTEQQAVSLRDQFLKLKRRKWLVLGTMLVVTLLTVLLVEQITPTYTATSTVMIEPRQQRTLDVEAVVSGLPPDVETIQGEIAIITSRGLAQKVIDKLDLARLPEFNPTLAAEMGLDGGPLDGLTDGLRGIVGWVGGLFGAEPARRGPDDPEAELRTRVVNRFLDRLSAAPRGRSRVIQIAFTSTDRQLAASVANTVADLYILEQLEAKYEATQRATDWLSARLTDLRARTEAAERAVEEYRARAGLLQGENTTTLATQELSRLNTELVILRSATVEAEARLRAAERAQGTTDASSLPMTVLQSPLIQSLQSQQIELNRRYADLSETFGERHPQIINIKAEMAELATRIRGEVNKIIGGLRNEVAIARERQSVVEKELEQMKTAAGERGTSLVQLRSLEEEAASNRLLLNTLMERFNETTLQQDLQQADVRLISPAPVPQAPSAPNKPLLVGLALFFSLVLGVVLAFIAEQLDQGFRSSEQLAAATGLPALGMLPVIGRRQRAGIAPADFFLRKPRSAFGEAVSSAVASLFLGGTGDRRPRTVMVTSALPNEGKSTTSINLARAVAQSGLRTLLIDADLRRPTLHTQLGLTLQPGLVEYLQDKATFEEIIQRDPRSSLDVIPAGGHVANPVHFLAADRTRTFLQGLTKYYDFVVVDSSPVMVVSDSRILARYVDETVFVVRWARTRREHVLHALRQLLEAGGELGGVLLTMVNTRRHADYSFGDSGQYHLGPRYYER